MAFTVTPLPSIGEVFLGQDAAGRELRVSGHPNSDRVVLSIWQSGSCTATVRLARADVPGVIGALATALVPGPAPTGPLAEVHELHPRTGALAAGSARPSFRAAGARLTSELSRLAGRFGLPRR